MTLSLVGDQSKDLLEYLDNSKDRIKHEITSGVFEFKMNGMIRIPNPNYNPEAEKAAKRARTEGILSNVSVEAMEQVSNVNFLVQKFLYCFGMDNCYLWLSTKLLITMCITVKQVGFMALNWKCF